MYFHGRWLESGVVNVHPACSVASAKPGGGGGRRRGGGNDVAEVQALEDTAATYFATPVRNPHLDHD